jgi:ATP adenylyltransferase
MKKLYAPWRSKYTQRIQNNIENNQTCIFCTLLTSTHDEENFILHRSEHTVIALNKYPYNPGHILVVPYTHTPTLTTLNLEIRTELMENCTFALHILESTLKNHGCNIGINIGKAAGAGIPEHIHMHVLPRFLGDTNFLPTLADTKQISIDLHDMYRTLVAAFKHPDTKKPNSISC